MIKQQNDIENDIVLPLPGLLVVWLEPEVYSAGCLRDQAGQVLHEQRVRHPKRIDQAVVLRGFAKNQT
jgi:hypothetical protein